MVRSHAIASDSLMKLFGLAGQSIVTAAVLISACGALNSQILTGARIPFAVAQDAPRFAWFGTVSSKYGTPLRAFLLNSGWAVALVLWGSFEKLLFFSGFANWLFFVLAGISVFLVRKQPSAAGSFSMMGYPFVPALFVVCAGLLCLTTIYHSPREALAGAFLILAGIPVYFWVRGLGFKPMNR
jgi:APA family basic amino acid/polyamine antiporter